MKVLVVGSGGREHTLVWKLKQSKRVKEIFCAPGNGGIEALARCVPIKADDIGGLIQFVQGERIDFTVVGPEVPLALGIVDEFEKRNLKIFGPRKMAAQLEGSKVFAKEFMKRHRIPTAAFESFDNCPAAENYIQKVKFPIVIKADGLAAGKGVVICNSLKEAQNVLDEIMTKRVFNEAGNQVVIEECLVGEEASILAISDGENFVMLDSAQDHKRIFDNDQGPNTGGMGAYSPAPVVSKKLFKEIATKVIKPVIDGMKQEGNIFKGVLYAGIMVTAKGPKVLEFNVRFGDPETQAILPRLKTDLLEIMLASCEGRLKGFDLEWDKRSCVCVVVASEGYPGDYEKGKEIAGLEAAARNKDVTVFHAGTVKRNGKILTSGGRVLGVTGLGSGIEQAVKRAYNSVGKIDFEGCYFRKDIAARAIERSKKK
ncbi:MAG TPA: phosphoribosylamine--glycine ligase [Candidatus Omnitrophota bacterium]|nr:phosphoribosylamine--glycine ligase [Candidatus Omnitrophota bacterium]HPD84352.1 phosphoribosylamine--glycine ligase [Candidatus Omnitrophota bacterium]HRZ03210.1 phosphoribosylamine--glycine ligase [Candidatus Omnitrophota bacterium]